MSLFQVYARALQYLATYRLRVSMVVVANIVLAVITIAEPIRKLADADSGVTINGIRGVGYLLREMA